MFSQEFLDFHQSIVQRNVSLFQEEYERNGRKPLSHQRKECIDQLVSITASFLFNIGCRLNSQYRKIILGNFENRDTNPDNYPWYQLLVDLLKLNPNSKEQLVSYFDTENLRQFLLMVENNFSCLNRPKLRVLILGITEPIYLLKPT
jgi:hypothetical protein